MDKGSIPAYKTKKTTYFPHIPWRWPIFDGFNFIWVGGDAFLRYDEAKILYFVSKEGTLALLCVELMLS